MNSKTPEIHPARNTKWGGFTGLFLRVYLRADFEFRFFFTGHTVYMYVAFFFDAPVFFDALLVFTTRILHLTKNN